MFYLPSATETHIEFAGFHSPISMAASAQTGTFLWALLDMLYPQVVIETGTGYTSVIIAKWLEELKASGNEKNEQLPIVYHVEHDSEWQAKVLHYFEHLAIEPSRFIDYEMLHDVKLKEPFFALLDGIRNKRMEVIHWMGEEIRLGIILIDDAQKDTFAEVKEVLSLLEQSNQGILYDVSLWTSDTYGRSAKLFIGHDSETPAWLLRELSNPSPIGQVPTNQFVQAEHIVNTNFSKEDVLITIVITCYNKGDYIGQSIESAISQTYSDIEVIVIDDGSTDHSSVVIDEYLDLFPGRFSVIDQENKGVAEARDIAIRSAKGKYIVVLDGDDFLHPRAVQTWYEYAEKHPEHPVVYSNAIRIDEDGKVKGKLQPVNHRLKVEGNILPSLLAGGIVTSTALIEREKILEVGGYNFRQKWELGHEDYFLYLRFALAGHHFGYIDQFLFFYRDTSNSLSKNIKRRDSGKNAALQYAYRHYITQMVEAAIELTAAGVQERLKRTQELTLREQEYQATIADLEARSSQELQRLQQQIRVVVEDLKAQITQELTAKDETHNAELERIQQESQTTIADLEMQNKRTLSARDEAYSSELRRLQQKTQAIIADLKVQTNQELSAKDEAYSSELRRLQQKTQAIIADLKVQTNQELSAKDEAHNTELETLNYQLNETLIQLDTMQKTQGWQVLEKWWGLKYRLFPLKSRRRRTFDLTRTSFGLLISRGPFALLKRMGKWLGGERRYYFPTVTAPKLPLLETMRAATENRPPEKSPFVRYPFLDTDFARHVFVTEPSDDQLRRQREEAQRWQRRPLLSIITPAYKPTLSIFEEACRSVLTQTYENFEWVVADASPDDEIWQFLQQKAAEDPRIKPVRVTENGGISANSNVALEAAQGEFIVLLDHDDTLAPNALYEVVKLIQQHPDADLVYSDEDKIDEQGHRCNPLFKPDWSPELMLCSNLITHLAVFRRSLLESVGFFNPETDGAQDWDIFLRISEHTDRIYHIPKLLYHWRMTPQSTAQSALNKDVGDVQLYAITNHLQRKYGIKAQVSFDLHHPIHRVYPRVRWQSRNVPKVSVVIPSIDHANILEKCLQTLYELTDYPNYEVIIVDTGSAEEETFALYRQYENQPNFRVINYTEPFNFSKACNQGATAANGDLFLFLNNDTEIIKADWLARMVQWFNIDEVGIVGAKLLYPSGSIQHAGVVLGIGGLASHLFPQEAENTVTIFGNDEWYRNFLAVTGACLLISRSAFNKVNGFDEGFQLNYSDVELCLQVYDAGYRIVYTPDARLIHHESVTHRRRIPRADFERADIYWEKWLQQGDPYFNCNLSVLTTSPTFRRGTHDKPSLANRNLMARLPHKEVIVLPDDLM